VYGCDVILLLELLLQGDFVKVAEPLFSFRILIEGKTAEDYQRDFQNRAPVTTTPYASLAARLLRTVYQSALSSSEKAEVFADFILTLTRENAPWRESITSELLGTNAQLDDPQFAFLLGLVLNGSVPLDEIKTNPISEAIYRAPLGAPDLLAAAQELLGKTETVAAGVAHVLFRKAAVLVDQGRLEEASDAFEHALQKHENSNGWSDWATVQMACNRLDAAERGLRRALRLDAKNGPAAAKLGILLANMGRITESIPYLEKSIPCIGAPQRAAIEELLQRCRQKLAPSVTA
jgi:tetratricopeptide (TPR) repeat protein